MFFRIVKGLFFLLFGICCFFIFCMILLSFIAEDLDVLPLSWFGILLLIAACALGIAEYADKRTPNTPS